MSLQALLALMLAGGCMVGEEGVDHGGEPQPHEDVEGAVLVLEGTPLASELAGSPGHEAGRDFVRLGVIFDGPSPTSIELSVSLDGERWSDWVPPTVHHVEREETGAFVGQIELLEGTGTAKYFRVRGEASFLRVEEMIFTQSQNVEPGEESEVGESALAEAVGGVEARSAWGARPSRCSSSLGAVRRMAIHHTESPTNDTISIEARLRQIQSYHMDVKGWCDIGYHYLVSRDGRIWEGRPAAKLGSHAGGANTGNVGIAVVGSHDTTPVSGTQIDALGHLVRAVANVHGIAIDRSVVKGHREYKSTSCPGDKLESQLETIVANGRDGGPTDAPPGGGDEEPATTIVVQGVLYAGNDPSDGIAGATIRIAGLSTTTGFDGAWQLTIPAGGYTVTASAPGFVGGSITRSATTDTWASFGLARTGSATGTAILQGVVYFGASGTNRIPFAAITLSTGHTLSADANGYYKVINLPAGSITVSASASGYATSSVSRTLANNVTEWGSVRLAP